jgi:hypothetical protein
LINAERTLLKNLQTQISPFLIPTPSLRSGQPPSRKDAGTTPLASQPTLNAEADLEKGLPMEVFLPEPFAGFRIDPRRILDARRRGRAQRRGLPAPKQLDSSRKRRINAGADDDERPAIKLAAPATSGRRQA